MSFVKITALILLCIAVSCNRGNRNEPSKEPRQLSLTVTGNYLNIPVSQAAERGKMSISVDGKHEIDFVVRLAPSSPDYWVFYEISQFRNSRLDLNYSGNSTGLKNIRQDENIMGEDSLYRESNRPRVHFTSRTGWNNDPNGLVYYEGEYHMFYQHNPFEREWENMSWGHAVSTDLIHWKELPVVMYPDSSGAIFSGTAVIDYKNTSGFGKDGIPPMVAVYTSDNSDNETQCIAFSLDRGRTFTKYCGNPVIDSKSRWKTKDLRDPDVFWHKPSGKWVMILFERDGNSVYTSSDLKTWNYESHTPGFWECPQLFELPVDGNENNKKWVMYGASGTYMTGTFDGRKFTPEAGKYYYGNGALYAAQVFENMPPSDKRCIQIGWGRIQQPGMAFNQMMLLPTELTLKTTKEGIRMFSQPVKEIDSLNGNWFSVDNPDPLKAEELLNRFLDSAAVRIKATIGLTHATDAGINLNGQTILRYDMNFNQVNGAFYSPEERTSMTITAEIIIDKTSVEVFIDGGAFSYAVERKAVPGSIEGFKFFGNNIAVTDLKVCAMRSIWN